ncbi:bifunctional DedA family/phosphatase PAP2 family protein [Paraburkholderia hospita]|uniref:bifunctional DedA family/phosphatase PAP2 family protein n=1 Tax=Paraburkholderia hospita TaxID=169430 RepID=UPI000B346AA5|nr:bifunctional DedA family/phosphatase PAP2 family protein [Paraburkholderia hospita]OUL73285.1 phosphoesterase [Paraburkholderia hospita]
MEHTYVDLLHLLAGHPAWTLAVVFIAAFLEAIAVIGTFIPGSTAIFLAGALVGTGSLNLGWVLALAILGAVAGDGLSYWLGSHYKDKIVQTWPFRRHPQVLDAGHSFFEKHGAKSVVFARFIGPLRAIVPVVAGMLGMTPMRFYVMNVFSALLWAPAHILPGVVFGASVQLAGAISFRIAVIIALLGGIVWVSFRVTRFVLSHASAWTNVAGRSLTTWAGQHEGRAGRLILRVLNPDRPAAGAIGAASVIALFSCWLFFGVLQDVLSGDPLVRVDMSVYHFLQSVRTPWSDSVLSGLATFGSVITLAALVVTAALWMVWAHRWRTLGYWFAAVIFSQLLILTLQFAIHRAPPDLLASGAYVFPSDHVAAVVVVYGFLAFLLTRRVGMLAGVVVVTTSTVVVVSVALAGVYFGRFWFSDSIGGAALALVWVAVVAFAAVWRKPVAPPSRGFIPALILTVMCVSVAVQSDVGRPTTKLDSAPAKAPVTATTSQWADTLWRRLPCYRSDMEGDRKEPLTIQWSGSIDEIGARLRTQGWVEGANLSARSFASLASPKASAMAMPVLPTLNDGVPSSAVFIHPGKTDDERDVLRFWPTDYVIEKSGAGAASAMPLWAGSLVHERLYRVSWPINMLRIVDPTKPAPATDNVEVVVRGVAVMARRNCHGVPVVLLTSSPI